MHPTEFWRERLEVPTYKVGEAARYARVSPQTVSSWEKTYDQKLPVVSSRASGNGLTFLQLIEVAVVAKLRKHGVKLSAIREARKYFSKRLASNYPFATERFQSDGVDILLDADGMSTIHPHQLIVANENGQYIWREFIQDRLVEFNYGDDGSVIQWKLNGLDSSVVIDPRICFGSPNVSGILTRAILEQHRLGVAVNDISEDYGITRELIADALKFEGIMEI